MQMAATLVSIIYCNILTSVLKIKNDFQSKKNRALSNPFHSWVRGRSQVNKFEQIQVNKFEQLHVNKFEQVGGRCWDRATTGGLQVNHFEQDKHRQCIRKPQRRTYVSKL